MRPPHTRGIAAALLAAALAGCGSAMAAQTPPQPAAGGRGASPAAGDTVPRRWTEADVRFMSAMIGHHAQAIEMARMAPTHGAGPQVRTLAERIINAQQDEIASMQLWLRDRAQPVPEPHAGGAHQHHAAGHDTMPGMLTEAQMKQLDEARGEEFDRLFLTFMIQHHQGAVRMVSELFSSYGAGQDETVFKLASDVNVDQLTEIARMQRMLADLLFGSPSP
ncbi:MAG TPA: DUF305 domain-containing protein [Longimicrobium sp.]|jgi:uncharacterized protein (DUF305 family)